MNGIKKSLSYTSVRVMVILCMLCILVAIACTGERNAAEPGEPAAVTLDQDGRTPLHKAVEDGDKEKVTRLLDQKLTIDTPDKNGYTPLHWAVLTGQEEIAALLIARGANVNTTLPGGYTPLHDAVYAGSKSLVQLLIANGANIYAADKLGKRPLDLAVELENQELILLLKPLHAAAQEGNLDKVKEILEKTPSSLEFKDENGWYPLHLAVKNGHAEIVQFLLDHGAAVNARGTYGMTPLRIALENHQDKIAALLQEKNARDESDELLLNKKLQEKEAVIWHLFHTCWAIKTKNYFLIFDYVPLEHLALPKGMPPCLANGEIEPQQLKDLDVVVFAPMVHNQNQVDTLFRWRKTIKKIAYVFGENKVKDSASIYIEPRGHKKFKNLEILTIPTTGFGEGFAVKVDGLTLFHGGDHESSEQSWDKYTREIDFLEKNIKDLDIVILQMAFQEQIDSGKGVLYALEKLKPAVMFPNTAIAKAPFYREFVHEVSLKKIPTTLECAEKKGDIFFYKKK